jgi:tetratricopeptide (TPR) repeat protein
MGNYREALEDFSNAISLKPKFPEAYYNRGLIYILLSDRKSGCEDLSKAGELGILDAYRVMKRYCYK